MKRKHFQACYHPFHLFKMTGKMYHIMLIWIFWAMKWVRLTIQKMLKEEEYEFSLKSSDL